jgi:hypothetical protein
MFQQVRQTVKTGAGIYLPKLFLKALMDVFLQSGQMRK